MGTANGGPSAGYLHGHGNPAIICIVAELKVYHAPDALGAVHQEVVQFPDYRKTANAIGDFLAYFDLLQKRAGSCLEPGRTFPDPYTVILCTERAALTQNQKGLVLTSTQGQLAFVGASPRWSYGQR